MTDMTIQNSKPKVLVTRKDIPKDAIDKLMKSCDVDLYPECFPITRNLLMDMIRGKDGVFCLLTDKIDSEVLDAAGPNLKVIGTMSVGYDHLNLSDIKQRGIKVGYTPGVLTDATAELGVALLLATSRRLFEAHDEMLNGRWSSWSPLWMAGHGLFESTVGIFGLGRIGQGVVKRLMGFRVKRFLYCGRSRKPEGDFLGAEYVQFDELLKESDFIIITASLTEETKEIFNKHAFEKMKGTAILINIARGGLVNQNDLIDALKSKKISAAGLDVMSPEPLPSDHPLLFTPNITLIPHIGSAEYQARLAMANLTVDNIVAALEGRPMPEQLC